MLETLHRKGIGSNFIEIVMDALNKKKDKAHLTGVKQKAGPTPVLHGELSGASQRISMREQEIIRLLADGLRNKEIANLLFVAEGTVKKHVYNIFQKLDVKSRVELISSALQSGLIEKS
jgi:DNA-binding NarL/FixJ family response regulator